MVYQKTGFTDEIHNIVLTVINNPQGANGGLCLDAIDLWEGKTLYSYQMGKYIEEPGTGWTRFNDRAYELTWSDSISQEPWYNCHNADFTRLCGVNSTVRFAFSGSRIRILAVVHPNCDQQVEVNMDGTVIDTFATNLTPVLDPNGQGKVSGL